MDESTRFPHPCGKELRDQVMIGVSADVVVPDEYFVVRGGAKEIVLDGTSFSATVGPTLEAACCGLPHGQIRFTRVGEVRNGGGSVTWKPEVSRKGTSNNQHVDVTLADLQPFSDLQSNPVPRKYRIDGDS